MSDLNSKLIDLAAARKERSTNAEDWDVLDAIADVVEKIASGEYKAEMIYIALLCDDGKPDAKRLEFSCAGCNALELKGLLADHLHYQCLPKKDD